MGYVSGKRCAGPSDSLPSSITQKTKQQEAYFYGNQVEYMDAILVGTKQLLYVGVDGISELSRLHIFHNKILK